MDSALLLFVAIVDAFQLDDRYMLSSHLMSNKPTPWDKLFSAASIHKLPHIAYVRLRFPFVEMEVMSKPYLPRAEDSRRKNGRGM